MWVCVVLGVRVPATSLFHEEKFLFFDFGVRGISKIKNFPRGSAQNLEKSGGFAWRREGVLPSPRSGSGRGARRRNGLGAVFEVFLGGGASGRLHVL